jgi:hypothetical protein
LCMEGSPHWALYILHSKGSSLCLAFFLIHTEANCWGRVAVGGRGKASELPFYSNCHRHCLFFSLSSRALIIYFIFYNCSDLNCLHLRCLNLLIIYRKV